MNIHIFDLPLEILDIIFEYCSGLSLIQVSLTCSRFYRLICGPYGNLSKFGDLYPNIFQKQELLLGWKSKGGFRKWRRKYLVLNEAWIHYAVIEDVNWDRLSFSYNAYMMLQLLTVKRASPLISSENDDFFLSNLISINDFHSQDQTTSQKSQTIDDNGFYCLHFEEIFHELSEYIDTYLWTHISRNFQLSVHFLRLHSCQLNWSYLCFNQQILSDSLIVEEFADKIVWSSLCISQQLDITFYKKFEDKLPFPLILFYQKLDQEMLEFLHLRNHLIITDPRLLNFMSPENYKAIQRFLSSSVPPSPTSISTTTSTLSRSNTSLSNRISNILQVLDFGIHSKIKK